MPVQFRQKNDGIGELARTLVSAPGIVQQNRQKAQQAAMDRYADAASMQKSIADARKSQAETSLLQDQHQNRQNLGEHLNTIDAYQNDRTMRVDPPAPGSADSPLEADVNDMIRGNQDLFVRHDMPSAEDYNEGIANLMRAFGGNAQQVTGGMQNVQNMGFQSEAANVARDDLSGAGLMAALNNIAAGNSMQPYNQNASGAVLNQYSGDVDVTNPLAQANIESEQALATQRGQETLTPQEKKYQALQQYNQSLVNEGKAPIPESVMRAHAAGTIDIRQDPVGLQTLIFDTARQQVIGTVDKDNGFQPFTPQTQETDDDGGSWLGNIWGAMTGSGGNEQPAPDQTGPAGDQGVYSPVLDRQVSQQELEATAQNRGITVDQVKQRLGIQ